MQMRYFGHKRTSWLCSGPRACSRKPLYSRDTWAVLPLARCVTAWWMIAKGGAEEMQPGQVWHEGIMEYTCADFVSRVSFCFCPSVPAAGSFLWQIWGPPSCVTFDRWRLTAHCFSAAEIWRFKSCLNQCYRTFLGTCTETHAHTKSRITHGSQWLSWVWRD